MPSAVTAKVAPTTVVVPQALDAGHPGDATFQGLPGRQHHPADPAVQGAGQVQRRKLDGERVVWARGSQRERGTFT